MPDQTDQDAPIQARHPAKRSRLRIGVAIVVTALLGAGGVAYANHTGFVDVDNADPGAFFHKAVAWAGTHGITTGYEGSEFFRPELEVTRGEVVTFLHRAHERFSPTLTLAASVSGGSLQRGVGATAVSQQQNLAYVVTFDRDVSQCYFQATPSTTQRIARASAVNGQPESVFVILADLGGSHASGNFHLTVTCENPI